MKLPPKYCKLCGKSFSAIQFPRTFRSQIYCSEKCYWISCKNSALKQKSLRMKEKRAETQPRICAFCGKEFDPKKFWYYRTVQTCSVKCTKSFHSQKVRHTPEGRQKHSFYQKNRKHRIRTNGGRGVTIKEWEAIKKKHGYQCVSCHRQEPFSDLSCKTLTMDHIIPITKGGKHEPNNIQPMCIACNLKKSNKT